MISAFYADITISNIQSTTMPIKQNIPKPNINTLHLIQDIEILHAMYL